MIGYMIGYNIILAFDVYILYFYSKKNQDLIGKN